MKKLLLSLAFALAALVAPLASHAAEDGFPWDKAPNRTNDLPALQNGAKLFVNYCLSCHSAAFMRYNRLQDIGLTEQQIKDNLLFTTDKVGDTMKAAIDPQRGQGLVRRQPARPDAGRPLALRPRRHGRRLPLHLPAHLLPRRHQGRPAGTTSRSRTSACRTSCGSCRASASRCSPRVEEHGHEVKVFKGWKQVTPGTMTPLQYDQAVGDLVGYLQWMGEPAQNYARARRRLGAAVPAGLHGDRLAPERGVLERRPLTGSTRGRRMPGARS